MMRLVKHDRGLTDVSVEPRWSASPHSIRSKSVNSYLFEFFTLDESSPIRCGHVEQLLSKTTGQRFLSRPRI